MKKAGQGKEEEEERNGVGSERESAMCFAGSFVFVRVDDSLTRSCNSSELLCRLNWPAKLVVLSFYATKPAFLQFPKQHQIKLLDGICTFVSLRWRIEDGVQGVSKRIAREFDCELL